VHDYVIVGGGRAGAAAVEGIRELDASGSILMIAAESHLPYDRPPLSKQLWTGKNEISDIFVHDRAYFERAGVERGRIPFAFNCIHGIASSRDDKIEFVAVLVAPVADGRVGQMRLQMFERQVFPQAAAVVGPERVPAARETYESGVEAVNLGLLDQFLQAVGVDSTKSFDIDGRPIPIADPASSAIKELLA